jgi:hypothetical protein
MSDVLTISSLFGLPNPEFAVSASDLLSGQVSDALQKLISMRAAGSGWKLLGAEICEKLAEVCSEINVVDILADVWNEYRMLEEYSDQKKHPRGETSLVPLFEHNIKSDQCVTVEITIAPFSHKIGFDISVSLTVKGIELKIKDARIQEILAGTIEGEGTISVESFEILRKTIDPVNIPGRMKLKGGILIEASKAARQAS